jgi:glycosyltransferase involved in cell wall biosynthesis
MMPGVSSDTNGHAESVCVSVVIATFNYARFLRESVESVLSQTWSDLEVIVVDDGSTDETPAIMHRWQDDARVIYLRQDHQGAAAAYNVGLRMASGAYVAVQGADDAWLPDKLSRQVAALEAQPGIGLVYSDTTVVDANGIPQRGHFYDTGRLPHVGRVLPMLLLDNFVPASSVVMRRGVLQAVGLHEETLEVCEDWDLWLRIAARFDFGYVDAPLVRTRRHGGNTHLRAVTSVRDSLRVLDRVPTMIGPWDELGRGLRARAYARAYARAASSLYTAGWSGRALGYLARAVLLDRRVVDWWHVKLAAKCALGIAGLPPRVA